MIQFHKTTTMTAITKNLEAIVFDNGKIKLIIYSLDRMNSGWTKKSLISAPFGVEEKDFTKEYVREQINEAFRFLPDAEEQINQLFIILNK
jgi:hypothetical protein